MIISSGIAKGLKLEVPDNTEIRPSQAMLRSSIANSVQCYSSGASVLDLCCGSGAVGLELLSRGASEAMFVDFSKETLHKTQANIDLFMKRVESQSLDKPQIGTLCWDLFTSKKPDKFLQKKFDIVFLDPPYSETMQAVQGVGKYLHELLNDQSVVFLETDKYVPEDSILSGLTKLNLKKTKTFGATLLYQFKFKD